MRAALLLTVSLSACSSVLSDADAERAYLGLDRAVERALELGLRGYSQASSANIAPQEGAGDVSGRMTVSGQVDQGSSSNKGLRLDVALVDYADDPAAEGERGPIVYDTRAADPAFLELKLRNVPDGTFTGTFDGTFLMRGPLVGEVTLDLDLAGELEPDPSVSGGTRRAPGTVDVTGTATTPGGGRFLVDVRL